MKTDPRIVPSLLSADWSRFGEEMALLEREGCDLFHVDVMDNRFVPNLTFGPQLVRDLAARSSSRFDVHLMVVHPEQCVPLFDHPSVEYITIHAEATPHLHRAIGQIHDLGKKAGVSLNPATPLSLVENVLADMDLLLIMSVNPGFGGQRYVPMSTDKIADAREMCEPAGVILEVDGGLGRETITEAAQAGAQWFVAGSAIYGTGDPAGTYRELCSRIRP